MRLARCVVALLAFAVPAQHRAGEPLPPAQFTQHFATALRAAAPDLTVTVVRDLELRAVARDERASTCFLDNAYAEYSRAPDDLDATVVRYVEATREAGGVTAPTPQRNRIVPVIKDRAWLEETRVALRERGAQDATRFAEVWEEYNSELLIFYAEDTPKTIRYLSDDDLRSLGLSRKELRRLGIRNLLSMLPSIELHGQDGVFMMTAGGDYEASLILADSIWDSGQVKVDGDVVVAIPSRDLLLICGSRHAAAIAKVREMATKMAKESPYRLTPTLFVRRKGTFRPL